MYRPHEARVTCVVFDGGADLGNQSEEIGFGHEDSRPERLLQLSLGYHSRPRCKQELQQVERLGREMNVCRTAI